MLHGQEQGKDLYGKGAEGEQEGDWIGRGDRTLIWSLKRLPLSPFGGTTEGPPHSTDVSGATAPS